MDTNGSTLQFRLENLEKIVQNFVPTKEYDLQNRMQKESSDRIEQDLAQVLTKVDSLHEKVNNSELQAQKRDAENKQALDALKAENKQAIDALQLKLFYSLLGLVGLVLVGIAIYYATNVH